MEQRHMVTVSSPPSEVFEEQSISYQNNEMAAAEGQYFERVEYPPEGGMIRHYYDHPYPAKGHPFPGPVDAIQSFKKLCIATANFIRAHYVLSGTLFALPRFITGRIFKSLVEYYFRDYVMAVLSPYFLADNRYCRSVREIRRAAKIAISFLSTEWQVLATELMKACTSTAEWDNAWRYRMQDVFSQLNKKAFLEDPAKEIMRLAQIEVRRERGWYEDKGRAMKLGKALSFAVKWNRPLREFLNHFIENVNIDEVKLDEADVYYNLMRPDYDINDWPMEVRQKKWVAIADKYQRESPDRIRMGKKVRDRIEAIGFLKASLDQNQGLPVALFYAVDEGENKVRINVLKTKLMDTSEGVRKACKDLIDGIPEVKNDGESKTN